MARALSAVVGELKMLVERMVLEGQANALFDSVSILLASLKFAHHHQ
jgi:hypothetical protein